MIYYANVWQSPEGDQWLGSLRDQRSRCDRLATIARKQGTSNRRIAILRIHPK